MHENEHRKGQGRQTRNRRVSERQAKINEVSDLFHVIVMNAMSEGKIDILYTLLFVTYIICWCDGCKLLSSSNDRYASLCIIPIYK